MHTQQQEQRAEDEDFRAEHDEFRGVGAVPDQLRRLHRQESDNQAHDDRRGRVVLTATRRGTAAKATTPIPAASNNQTRRRGGSAGECGSEAQRSTRPAHRVRSESSWALPIDNPATTPNVSRQAVARVDFG